MVFAGGLGDAYEVVVGVEVDGDNAGRSRVAVCGELCLFDYAVFGRHYKLRQLRFVLGFKAFDADNGSYFLVAEREEIDDISASALP